MTKKHNSIQEMDPSFKPLMKSFAIDLIVYIPLATIYFLILIRFAQEPLIRLFAEKPVGYGFFGLAILVSQAVFLEIVISWLLRRIGLRN